MKDQTVTVTNISGETSLFHDTCKLVQSMGSFSNSTSTPGVGTIAAVSTTVAITPIITLAQIVCSCS